MRRSGCVRRATKPTEDNRHRSPTTRLVCGLRTHGHLPKASEALATLDTASTNFHRTAPSSMTHRTPHHDRALELVRTVESEFEIACEVALPESARRVDVVLPFGGNPSDAWGPLHADLAHRDMFLELYSRAVPAMNLITCVLESVWGYEQWHNPRRTRRTDRPPLCLVISDGRPRTGLRDLPCFRPSPAVTGLYRLECGYQVLLVDAKRITGPGTSFLRLLPTRLEERGDKTLELLNDPALKDSTKRKIGTKIMDNDEEFFGKAEQESAARVLLKRSEKRGEKRGRRLGERRGRRLELLDMAREAGASEDDLAELEAIEDLEALRAATLELVRRLA